MMACEPTFDVPMDSCSSLFSFQNSAFVSFVVKLS
jgi:hypothetical protein